MFNRDKDTDQTESPSRPAFRMPTLHTWKLRRLKLPKPGEIKTLELQEYIIEAHGVTHLEGKGGVVFMRYFLDPVSGPSPHPVESFADYYDYKMVVPVVAEPSRIIQ